MVPSIAQLKADEKMLLGGCYYFFLTGLWRRDNDKGMNFSHTAKIIEMPVRVALWRDVVSLRRMREEQ
jgi:hypothetical protein